MSQIQEIYTSLIYRDYLLKTEPIIYNPAYEIISCNNFLNWTGIDIVIHNGGVSKGKGLFAGYNSSNQPLYKNMCFSGTESSWDTWANNQGCFGAAIKKDLSLSSKYTFLMWLNPGAYGAQINNFLCHYGNMTNIYYLDYLDYYSQNIASYLTYPNNWYLIGIQLERASSTDLVASYFIYDPKHKAFTQQDNPSTISNLTHYMFLYTPRKVQSFSGTIVNSPQIYDMRIFDKSLTRSDIKLLGDYPIIISK